MEVIIRSNAGQVAELAARLIAARLRAKPDLVLGLACIAHKSLGFVSDAG